MANADSTNLRCNWPTPLYLSAMIFALVTLVMFTPALDGYWRNAIRGAMQALVLFVFLGRMFLALRRGEQSKVWIPSVVLMFLAAPLWLLMEPLLFKMFYLGKSVLGTG